MSGTNSTTELAVAARKDLDFTMKLFEGEYAHRLVKRALVRQQFNTQSSSLTFASLQSGACETEHGENPPILMSQVEQFLVAARSTQIVAKIPADHLLARARYYRRPRMNCISSVATYVWFAFGQH